VCPVPFRLQRPCCFRRVNGRPSYSRSSSSRYHIFTFSSPRVFSKNCPFIILSLSVPHNIHFTRSYYAVRAQVLHFRRLPSCRCYCRFTLRIIDQHAVGIIVVSAFFATTDPVKRAVLALLSAVSDSEVMIVGACSFFASFPAAFFASSQQHEKEIE